jgi:hypothetical protein
MSKKDKFNFAKLENVDKHYQGIGYHVPAGYTKQEIQKLFKLWNKKLQNSGHVELEYFSSTSPGRSSPFFCESRTQGIYKHDNYQISEYYNLIQTYFNLYMNTDAARKRYKHNYTIYRIILEHYITGMGFQSLCKLLTDRSIYNAYADKNTATALYQRNNKRTKFWSYTAIRRMLNHCWLWHAFDINGEVTPQQLQYFDFLGLDVPGTQDTLNAELARQGLELVQLRIPEKSLFVKDKCEPIEL